MALSLNIGLWVVFDGADCIVWFVMANIIALYVFVFYKFACNELSDYRIFFPEFKIKKNNWVGLALNCFEDTKKTEKLKYAGR